MKRKVVMAVLAISLLANVFMGILLVQERLASPNQQLNFLTGPGTTGGILSSGNTPLALNPGSNLSDQPRRYAALQGPAVLIATSYVRQGPFIYQQTNETGAMTNISVEIIPGEGRVLVHTTPLMGMTFQDAANTAVQVTRNRTNVDLSTSDIIFSIEASSEIPAIDGPSAGALMTAITEAAVTGRPLWENRTITGTINPDGSIGAIGGVIEKATAAKEAGKDAILLPRENADIIILNQGVSTVGRFRTVEQRPEYVSAKDYIESNIGIRVEYVDTIEDVEEYLFSK
jgi:hypothetical protein